jgi:hypothetical protein
MEAKVDDWLVVAVEAANQPMDSTCSVIDLAAPPWDHVWLLMLP